MHHSGIFMLPLCRGTVVVLDLHRVWGSDSHIALTVPRGKEGAVYTSSAAPWSGQGGCLPTTERGELSSSGTRVARARGCVQVCLRSRSADGCVGSVFWELWFPTQHFTSQCHPCMCCPCTPVTSSPRRPLVL